MKQEPSTKPLEAQAQRARSKPGSDTDRLGVKVAAGTSTLEFLQGIIADQQRAINPDLSDEERGKAIASFAKKVDQFGMLAGDPDYSAEVERILNRIEVTNQVAKWRQGFSSKEVKDAIKGVDESYQRRKKEFDPDRPGGFVAPPTEKDYINAIRRLYGNSAPLSGEVKQEGFWDLFRDTKSDSGFLGIGEGGLTISNELANKRWIPPGANPELDEARRRVLYAKYNPIIETDVPQLGPGEKRYTLKMPDGEYVLPTYVSEVRDNIAVAQQGYTGEGILTPYIGDPVLSAVHGITGDPYSQQIKGLTDALGGKWKTVPNVTNNYEDDRDNLENNEVFVRSLYESLPYEFGDKPGPTLPTKLATGAGATAQFLAELAALNVAGKVIGGGVKAGATKLLPSKNKAPIPHFFVRWAKGDPRQEVSAAKKAIDAAKLATPRGKFGVFGEMISYEMLHAATHDGTAAEGIQRGAEMGAYAMAFGWVARAGLGTLGTVLGRSYKAAVNNLAWAADAHAGDKPIARIFQHFMPDLALSRGLDTLVKDMEPKLRRFWRDAESVQRAKDATVGYTIGHMFGAKSRAEEWAIKNDIEWNIGDPRILQRFIHELSDLTPSGESFMFMLHPYLSSAKTWARVRGLGKETKAERVVREDRELFVKEHVLSAARREKFVMDFFEMYSRKMMKEVMKKNPDQALLWIDKWAKKNPREAAGMAREMELRGKRDLESGDPTDINSFSANNWLRLLYAGDRGESFEVVRGYLEKTGTDVLQMVDAQLRQFPYERPDRGFSRSDAQPLSKLIEEVLDARDMEATRLGYQLLEKNGAAVQLAQKEGRDIGDMAREILEKQIYGESQKLLEDPYRAAGDAAAAAGKNLDDATRKELASVGLTGKVHALNVVNLWREFFGKPKAERFEDVTLSEAIEYSPLGTWRRANQERRMNQQKRIDAEPGSLPIETFMSGAQKLHDALRRDRANLGKDPIKLVAERATEADLASAEAYEAFIARETAKAPKPTEPVGEPLEHTVSVDPYAGMRGERPDRAPSGEVPEAALRKTGKNNYRFDGKLGTYVVTVRKAGGKERGRYTIELLGQRGKTVLYMDKGATLDTVRREIARLDSWTIEGEAQEAIRESEGRERFKKRSEARKARHEREMEERYGGIESPHTGELVWGFSRRKKGGAWEILGRPEDVTQEQTRKYSAVQKLPDNKAPASSAAEELVNWHERHAPPPVDLRRPIPEPFRLPEPKAAVAEEGAKGGEFSLVRNLIDFAYAKPEAQHEALINGIMAVGGNERITRVMGIALGIGGDRALEIRQELLIKNFEFVDRAVIPALEKLKTKDGKRLFSDRSLSTIQTRELLSLISLGREFEEQYQKRDFSRKKFLDAWQKKIASLEKQAKGKGANAEAAEMQLEAMKARRKPLEEALKTIKAARQQSPKQMLAQKIATALFGKKKQHSINKEITLEDGTKTTPKAMGERVYEDIAGRMSTEAPRSKGAALVGEDVRPADVKKGNVEGLTREQIVSGELEEAPAQRLQTLSEVRESGEKVSPMHYWFGAAESANMAAETLRQVKRQHPDTKLWEPIIGPGVSGEGVLARLKNPEDMYTNGEYDLGIYMRSLIERPRGERERGMPWLRKMFIESREEDGSPTFGNEAGAIAAFEHARKSALEASAWMEALAREVTKERGGNDAEGWALLQRYLRLRNSRQEIPDSLKGRMEEHGMLDSRGRLDPAMIAEYQRLVADWWRTKGSKDPDNAALLSQVSPETIWMYGGLLPLKALVGWGSTGFNGYIPGIEKFTATGRVADWVLTRPREFIDRMIEEYKADNPRLRYKALNQLFSKLVDPLFRQPIYRRLMLPESAGLMSSLSRERTTAFRTSFRRWDHLAREFRLEQAVFLRDLNATKMPAHELELMGHALNSGLFRRLKRDHDPIPKLSKALKIGLPEGTRMWKYLKEWAEMANRQGHKMYEVGLINKKQWDRWRDQYVMWTPKTDLKEEVARAGEKLQRWGHYGWATTELTRVAEPKSKLMQHLDPNVILPAQAAVNAERIVLFGVMGDLVRGSGAIHQRDYDALPSSEKNNWRPLALTGTRLAGSQASVDAIATAMTGQVMLTQFRDEVRESMHRKRRPNESIREYEKYVAKKNAAHQRAGKRMLTPNTDAKQEIVDRMHEMYVPIESIRKLENYLVQLDPTYMSSPGVRVAAKVMANWRRLKTVFEPVHLSLNIWSSIVNNDMLHGVSKYNFLSSFLTGEGHYADALRIQSDWVDWKKGINEFKGWGSGNKKLLNGHPKQEGIELVEQFTEWGGAAMMRTEVLGDIGWRGFADSFLNVGGAPPPELKGQALEQAMPWLVLERTGGWFDELGRRMEDLALRGGEKGAERAYQHGMEYYGLFEQWMKLSAYLNLRANNIPERDKLGRRVDKKGKGGLGLSDRQVAEQALKATAHYGAANASVEWYTMMINPGATSAAQESAIKKIRTARKGKLKPSFHRPDLYNTAARGIIRSAIQRPFQSYQHTMVPQWAYWLPRSPLKVIENYALTTAFFRTATTALALYQGFNQAMLDQELAGGLGVADLDDMAFALNPEQTDALVESMAQMPILAINGASTAGAVETIWKRSQERWKEDLKNSLKGYRNVHLGITGRRGAETTYTEGTELYRPGSFITGMIGWFNSAMRKEVPLGEYSKNTFFNQFLGMTAQSIIGTAGNVLGEGIWGRKGESGWERLGRMAESAKREFGAPFHPKTWWFSEEFVRLMEMTVFRGLDWQSALTGISDPARLKQSLGDQALNMGISAVAPAYRSVPYSKEQEPITMLDRLMTNVKSTTRSAMPASTDKYTHEEEQFRKRLHKQVANIARDAYFESAFGGGQGLGLDSLLFLSLNNKRGTPLFDFVEGQVAQGTDRDLAEKVTNDYLNQIKNSNSKKFLTDVARVQRMSPNLFARMWYATLDDTGGNVKQLLDVVHRDVTALEGTKELSEYYTLFADHLQGHPFTDPRDVRKQNELSDAFRGFTGEDRKAPIRRNTGAVLGGQLYDILPSTAVQQMPRRKTIPDTRKRFLQGILEK